MLPEELSTAAADKPRTMHRSQFNVCLKQQKRVRSGSNVFVVKNILQTAPLVIELCVGVPLTAGGCGRQIDAF